MTTTLEGQYSGSSFDGGGDAVARAWVTSGPTACTTSRNPCIITVINLGVSGLFGAADPSALVPGDSLTSIGGNNAYDASVGGNASNCGALIAFNNGSVVLLGAVFEVV